MPEGIRPYKYSQTNGREVASSFSQRELLVYDGKATSSGHQPFGSPSDCHQKVKEAYLARISNGDEPRL